VLVLIILVPQDGRSDVPAEEGATSKPTAGKRHLAKFLSEINRRLTNPVGNIWSLGLIQNNYLLSSPTSYNAEFKFEPLLPITLTANWNLVLKPEFVLVDSMPYTNSEGNQNRATGLGDMTFAVLLSRERSSWVLALGPTFVLPTATTQETGAGKWQVGPAAAFGYHSKRLMLVLFPQQWWSFAGQSARSPTSQLKLQYFISYFFNNGWSIGTSPSIVVNWDASAGQKLTFPVGLGAGKVLKVFRVPVKFALEVQYMPIRPDSYGQEWNVEISIVPSIWD